MIHELLMTGADNPTTGRELAAMLNCDIRNVTEAVEQERRAGQPICATTSGNHKGYFLAADRDELQTYCTRLHKRAGELHKTRRFLLKALEQMPEE